MASYRPKIKIDSAGNTKDLPLDAETLKGKNVDYFANKNEVNAELANKMNNGIIQTYRGNEVSFKTQDGNSTDIYFNFINEQNNPITTFSFGVGNGTTSPKATINCGNINCAEVYVNHAFHRADNAEYFDFIANGVNWGLKGRKSTVHDLGAMQDDINSKANSFNPTITFGEYGSSYISSGNGDGAEFDKYNIRISSWYGIGFPTELGNKQNNIVFDTRNGNMKTKGTLYVQSNKVVATEEQLNATNQRVNNKQNTLVSGSNIKTINGQSLLGSGDISIKVNIDDIYPVGSIYMSVNSTSPSSIFGGKWEPLRDRFLIGSGQYANGVIGGETAVQLKYNQMPAHTHSGLNWGNNFLSFDQAPGTDTRGGWVISGTWISSSANSYKFNVKTAGANEEHNNMPPYLSVNMWKRVE